MKALTRYSDRPVLESIKRDMDRFFDDIVPFSWRLENGGRSSSMWMPNTDMSETENDYIITVDLPGITKKDVEVNFQNNRLTISGERKKEKEEEGKDFIRRERYEGTFMRSFSLPTAVKEEDINAKFKDGVLTVTVPKAEVSKSKKIAIE